MSQVDRALAAVNGGALSVEQLVRHALAPRANFARWLETALRRAASTIPVRPRLWNAPSVPRTVARRAVRRVRRLLTGKPGVLSVHWGVRRVRYRTTGEAAVVVVVDTKLPESRLPSADTLPSGLTVRQRGRIHRIPIDVQAFGGFARPHASAAFRPGNRTSVFVKDARGTLGGILRGAEGWTAVLSGHVAEARDLPVRASIDGEEGDLGRVTECIVDAANGDIALTGPIPDQAFADRIGLQLAATRDPDEADLHTELRIFVTRDFNPLTTYISDVGVSAPFDYPGRGRITLQNLVATTPLLTQDGDSGAPAVDYMGRVAGFVIGAWDGKTFLMPARRGIDEL